MSTPDDGRENFKDIIFSKVDRSQENKPALNDFECYHCQKTFKRKPHLKRHLHTVHPFNVAKKEYAEEDLRSLIGYECHYCERNYSRRDNLTAHLRRKHSNTKPTTYHECPHCGVICIRKSSLSRHFLTNHSTDGKEVDQKNPRNIAIKCILCGSSFAQKLQVLLHYEELHKVKIESESLRFTSKHEFLEWKKGIETTMTCHFMKRNFHNYKDHSLTTFACHRSGMYESKANKRRAKLIGSKKINGLCPAEIKLHTTKKGTHNVVFVKTHVGHSIGTEEETSHIFYISNKDRCRIASRISAGIPVYGKLDDAEPAEAEDRAYTTEIHLLNDDDLRSVLSRNSKTNATRFAFDDVKVEDFLRRNASAILYFKAEGSTDGECPALDADDSVLVFMNAKQEEMLKRFGGDVVALDTVHVVGHESVALQTLLVVDEYRESYPVAFAVSNRDDAPLIKKFLSCVKDKVGALQPNLLMTDTTQNDYDSWIRVMGRPRRRAFCSWHVQEQWQRDLQLISDKRKRENTKRLLHDLSAETDVTAFEGKLRRFVQQDEDAELAPFLAHFRATHVNTADAWAYCRWMRERGPAATTNMYVRSFNKHCKYRRGSTAPVTRSMSVGLQTIEKHLLRKEVDFKRRESRGKLAAKLSTLKQRHDALEVNKIGENVNAYIERTGVPNEWHVGSFATPDDGIIEMYLVSQIMQTKCSKCPLLCEKCDACFHQFQCTCDDWSVMLNMCKHIHALGLFLKYDLIMDESATEYVVAESVDVEPSVEIVAGPEDARGTSVADGAYESLDDEKRRTEALFRELLQTATTTEDLEMIRESLTILSANIVGYQEYPVNVENCTPINVQ